MRPFLPLLFFPLALTAEAWSQSSESGSLNVYADLYQGKPTASGELYDRSALTAAHATLPFGTWVRVANFETGRMVDLQVNDRKRQDGRLLTLSRAGADRLGLGPNKIAPGSLMVLSAPTPTAPQAAAPVAAPSATSAVPPGTPAPRKFRPLAGLFGKEAATAGVAPAASPLQYGIPRQRYSPPEPGGKGLFSSSGKTPGWFGSKPTVPAPVYPSPFPTSAGSVARPNDLMAMNATLGRSSIPGPSPAVPGAPMPPQAASPATSVALPPASPNAPYRVQFGAFRRISSADELSGMLDGAGVPTSVFAAPGSGLNVVVTDAGFRSADEAQRWIDFEGARRGWTDRPVVIR